MSEVFNFEQRECLRLLKDYAVTFAMDEVFAHECEFHNATHGCELHKFCLEKLSNLKEQAEVCGWTETISVLRS